MSIPDDILLFGGFALAHAAYSICDVPAGQLLIPLFIAEHQGKREVRRFEAATQEEAITAAKRHIETVDGTLDLWTFSREGSMVLQDDSRTDVICCVSAQAVHHPVVSAHFASRRFRIVGDTSRHLGGRRGFTGRGECVPPYS